MRSICVVMLVIVFLVSGCKTVEPELKAPVPVKVPDSFSIELSGEETTAYWWMSFYSDELNTLIKDAIDNNFDLQVLKTKIDQAEASVRKEAAADVPGFGFSFGGEKRRTKIKTDTSAESTYKNSHSWDGSLTGTYTADVWGEIEAEQQSKRSDLKAAVEDLSFSTLELSADVAETWVDIIASRNEKNILDNQIRINKTLLELQKLRYANGKANALDVSQQREALAEANSQVPLLERQEGLLLNSLAFLIGKARPDTIKISTRKLPEPVPLPRVGIPSDVLKNRPDIIAAKHRLSSAQWEISAAKADFLPSFELTAKALFSSGELDLLFHNWVATLAASIAGPVFDGGVRKAELERVKAAAQEQLNLYAKTVAGAIREVEDSLIKIEKQDAYIQLLEEELSVARITLKDARIQYLNGQSSYLNVLSTWTSIERLERQLVGERATYIKDRIGLHKALGWKGTSKEK